MDSILPVSLGGHHWGMRRPSVRVYLWSRHRSDPGCPVSVHPLPSISNGSGGNPFPLGGPTRAILWFAGAGTRFSDSAPGFGFIRE